MSIQTLIDSLVNSLSNETSTFITGYYAAGNYWEVHRKFDWLP